MSAVAKATKLLIEQVSHEHGIDLAKLQREFDPKWAIEREQAAGNSFGPFHQKLILDKAPWKVQRILGEMKKRREMGVDLRAASQTFASNDPNDFWSASGTAINTTTTETNLWNPAILAPLPVGVIRSGKSWKADFGGVMGTTATPTIVMTARVGTNNSVPPTGTTMGAGPTFTLGTFTAQPCFGSFVLGCRSIGIAASTAAMAGTGFIITAGAAAATTAGMAVMGGALPTTVDQSIAQGLAVSIIWGASSASNTITPQWMTFAGLN